MNRGEIPIELYNTPRTVLVPPNRWRQCIISHQQQLAGIAAAGGLRKLCCRSNYAGSETPWIQAPATSRRFQETGSALVSALVIGTDYTIHSFEVPQGMDGLLSAHFQFYTGSGYVDGSGDIVWRVRINRSYLKDYSDMQTSLGNTSSPVLFNRGGVRVFSRDKVEYIAMLGPNAGINLDPQARIIVSVTGYYYPQE